MMALIRPDMPSRAATYGELGPWYGNGKTRPVEAEEAHELLSRGKSVEARTREGYQTLFRPEELTALEALEADPPGELAATVLQLKGQLGNKLPETYARLSQGQRVSFRARPDQSVLVVSNLDELKLASYLNGLGAKDQELAQPALARSLKALCDTGRTLTRGLPESSQTVAMALYRGAGDEVRLAGLTFKPSELDDDQAVLARLEPLNRLTRELKDPALADAAHRAVQRDCEHPMSARLEAAVQAFEFAPGRFGHFELYQQLLDHGDSELEAIKQALGPGAEPFGCRDALVRLREGGPREDFLRLLALSGDPDWSARQLQENPAVDRLRSEEVQLRAGWQRIKWRHLTSHLLARSACGSETREERELALARIYSDCQRDMAATRAVWSELRATGDLPVARQAHDRLQASLRRLNPRGRGWQEVECLQRLRLERQTGGALAGKSLLEAVDILCQNLNRQAESRLFDQSQPERAVASALEQVGRSSRGGVEERQGQVVVGSVRLPTRQHQTTGVPSPAQNFK